MISLLNPQPNERIDLADFTHLAQQSVLGALRAAPSALLTDPSKQTLWIIRGFTLSNPSGQVLSVAKGSALLALRKGAQVLTGVVTDDGQTTQSVDLSSYAAGSYGVFIRFILAADSYDTRAFFRASGGGEEYGQSVPTRLNGNWEINVARTTPGEEWLQVGAVVAPSMALTDTRPLYFEGRVDGGTASGWGTADDRNDDRGAHGVGDLQTALAALRQGLEDIKGPGLARWYSSFVAGQSIGFAGTQVAGRTQWLDSGFYMQGDAARPRLNFAADGAHLAYTRGSALLAATGAELPTAQGSSTTALALRSGTGDEALLRGSFFRSGTTTGFAGVDAFWGRGQLGSATGGVGFYGAQGLMGGAGVGLGYALGNQAPSLFVGASGSVGVGLGLASRLLGDARAALQVAALGSTARGLALTNGSAVQGVLAYHNGSTMPGTSGLATGLSMDLPNGSPWLVTQSGQDVGFLGSNGRWRLGGGPQNDYDAATVTIPTAPTVVASVVDNPVLGPITNYAQTATLLLSNSVLASSAAGSGFLATRLSFAQGTQRLYDIEASSVALAANDVVQGQGIWSYGRTAKVLTMGVPTAGPAFRATQQAGFAFSPTITHQDTYPGTEARVAVGTLVQNTTYSFTSLQSVNNVIQIALPLRLMAGQQLTAVSVFVNATNTATVQITNQLLSYNVFGGQETTLAVSTPTAAPGNNVAFSTGFSTSTTSTAGSSLTFSVRLTSTAAFSVDIKGFVVALSTTALNPQRQ